MINKLGLMLKSRTFWTIGAAFIVNFVGAIHGIIPGTLIPLIDGILGLMTIYFKLNPSQNYSSTQVIQ